MSKRRDSVVKQVTAISEGKKSAGVFQRLDW